MDRKIQTALVTLFPNQRDKIHLLSELVGKSNEIADPAEVSGLETQNKIFTEINDTIVRGFPHLLSLIAAPI